MDTPRLYTQDNRPLRIAFEQLEKDAFLIEKLTGVEALSQPFEFHLQLLAEREIDFNKVLGKPALVTLDLQSLCTDETAKKARPNRHFHGIISQLSQGQTVQGRLVGSDYRNLIRYSAVMVPRLWLLTLRKQSRVFHNKSVREISKAILKDEWGLNVTIPEEPTARTRDHCLQYQESDFAFVSQMMEQEGLRYYFIPKPADGGKHDMILSGYESVFPMLSEAYGETPGNKPRAFDKSAIEELNYREARTVITWPFVSSWKKMQRLTTAKFNVRDFSLEKSTDAFAATEPIASEVQAGIVVHALPSEEAHQNYEPAGGISHRFEDVGKLSDESTREAKLRAIEASCRALQIQGTSDAAQLLPGFAFKLKGLAHAEGQYRITRVEHVASILIEQYRYTEKAAEERDEEIYRNHFECLPDQPATLKYCPPQATPTVLIEHPLFATVTGTEESDPKGAVNREPKQGHVKVQFHWTIPPDNKGDHDAISCWVPVSQGWAGPGYGSFFLPRIGDEVIVAFVNGEKDRPIIVGRVYHNVNPPPFQDGSDVSTTKSGIRTQTVGGDSDDYNELSFDDKKDNEAVMLRANRDYFERVGHNRASFVGVDQWFRETFASASWSSGLPTWLAAMAATIPSNEETTFGFKTAVVSPSNTEITIPSKATLVVDPFDYAANKLLGGGGNLALLQTIVSLLPGGKTDVVYGNATNIHYGTVTRGFYRGLLFQSVLRFTGTSLERAFLRKLSILHSLSLVAGTFLRIGVGKTSGTSQAFSAVTGALNKLHAGALLALKYFDLKYHKQEVTQKLTAHQTFVGGRVKEHYRGKGDLWETYKGVYNDVKKNFQDETAQGGNHVHDVERNYSLTCGGRVVLSADADVYLCGKQTAGVVARTIGQLSKWHEIDSDNIFLRASQARITLGLGDEKCTRQAEAGVIDQIFADEIGGMPAPKAPGGITISVSEESKIEVTKDGITLAVGKKGEETKLELTKNKIVMTCGDSTITLRPSSIKQVAQKHRKKTQSDHVES